MVEEKTYEHAFDFKCTKCHKPIKGFVNWVNENGKKHAYHTDCLESKSELPYPRKAEDFTPYNLDRIATALEQLVALLGSRE